MKSFQNQGYYFIHAQIYLTQSTDSYNAFPAWYSFRIIFSLPLIVSFIWNIRYIARHSKA